MPVDKTEARVSGYIPQTIKGVTFAAFSQSIWLEKHGPPPKQKERLKVP